MKSNQEVVSIQDLVAFVLGEADGPTATRVKMAMQDNPQVSRELERVEAMLTTLRQGVFEPVPAALKKAARELWSEAATPSLTEWLGGILESTLSVVFDSHQAPELAGFRGESSGHHMTFSDNNTEVDVLIEREGDLCVVRGQVMGTGADMVAAVAETGQVVASTSVGPDGTFALTVSPQVRDLSIRSEAGAFRLRGIQ